MNRIDLKIRRNVLKDEATSIAHFMAKKVIDNEEVSIQVEDNEGEDLWDIYNAYKEDKNTSGETIVIACCTRGRGGRVYEYKYYIEEQLEGILYEFFKKEI